MSVASPKRQLEPTKHISWPTILAKVVNVAAQCVSEADQQLCPTFQTSHLIAWSGLQALCQLLNCQVIQGVFVDLELVVGVA